MQGQACVEMPCSGHRHVGTKVDFDLKAHRGTELFRSLMRRAGFRKRCFPEATDEQWNDWHWQLRKSVRSKRALTRVLKQPLSDDESSALDWSARRGFLPMSMSPYYASLLDDEEASRSLRQTVIPVSAEQTTAPHEIADPLAEDNHRVAPGLVHRYPDRVLFLVTRVCASYCRFCTRSRLVGSTHDEYKMTPADFDESLAYVRKHPEIRDVLLSGGDPLMLSDETLDYLLGSLAAIPHVELVRIGSKIPVALPQRITPSLVDIFRRHRPVWMSVNVTSHFELTDEANEALSALADVGVPLGSQTVLLRGVNDSMDLMRKMMHRLIQMRVRPYYLYQLDPVAGSSHFQVPLQRGIDLIEGLRGHTSGYAVPTFVVDTPGGKIPISPNYFVGREGQNVILRNYEGKEFRYHDVKE